MRTAIAHFLERISKLLIYIGGFVVLVQALWISYGVFMRYVLNSPDGMVTEATALMLVPVAFFGLAYALSQDAYPKVTMLRDKMPVHIQGYLDRLNLFIMTLTGLFFSVAACKATVKSYHSGSASEILLWPRFYFWIPVSIALVIFTLLAFMYFLNYQHPSAHKDKETP